MSAPVPPETARPSRPWYRALQLIIAALVVWFVGVALVRNWAEVRAHAAGLDLRWGWILASAALVLLTYGVLVLTWREMLRSWGAQLPFGTAARIWSISNLGRYIPGKVWQIGAMGKMAHDAGVSPVAAAGTAVLSTVVNISVGLAIAVLAGWPQLDALSDGRRVLAIALLAGAIAGLTALPLVLPRLVPWLERRMGRPVGTGTVPMRAIAIAIVGNAVAWLLYGVAFQWLTIGVLGSARGTALDYITVFAASYVVGYLFLILPAGVGVREAVLVEALRLFGLAAIGPAAIMAVVSRLWLTVLEVIPGFLFLALRPRR